MERKVRDVMTPEPMGVYYDQTMADAARVMRDSGVGAVLVVNERELVGVVTDRDIVVRGVAESVPPDAPIGPLCSQDLIGVHADEDTGEAVKLMRQNALRRLPVVDDGQVAGMVSLGDLAIALDEHSALARVSQATPNTLHVQRADAVPGGAGNTLRDGPSRGRPIYPLLFRWRPPQGQSLHRSRPRRELFAPAPTTQIGRTGIKNGRERCKGAEKWSGEVQRRGRLRKSLAGYARDEFGLKKTG